MATHRKKSAKKRIRTGEFAVAAFLGLAVTAAPAIAAADTSDGPSTGPSADKGSASNATAVKTGPKAAKSGKTGADNGATLRAQAAAAAEEKEESALGDEDAAEDTEGDGAETVAESGTGTETEISTGAGEVEAPPSTETGGTGTEVVEPPSEPEVTDPAVTDPAITEPEVIEPEVIETPKTPETAPVVDVIEIPSSDQSASSLSLKGSDPSPTPTALASALLDINLDIVPKPPVIPAFAPLMGIINGLASWVDKVFPPYAADPLLSPTQVAAGYVMTLLAGLQSSYWQGQPTPFTFGALVLVTAAYARYERLATNHLPGAPTVSAGPLPLTWKLKSIDPDGDLLVYSVDLNGQPSNGLITMSPDGTFSFIPTSLTDLNDGTDVTFTVRVNDSLGMLEHPINPEGNDAFYTVSFRYPGLGINNLPVFTPPGQATVVGTDGNTGKVTISAQATDADGDPLTYTATSLFGTVTRNEDGTFTYTPNAAARHAAASDLAAALGLNKDLVSIWANDGRGGITLLPTTVTVDIVGANNAPTVTVKPPAISDPLTGLIAGGFEIDDDDNDLVTFSPLALTTSRGGIVTVTGLGYTYLPSIQARSQGGTDTFTVTADDGHGGTVEVSITVTIAKFNLGPVGGITVATPDSDGVVRGQVAATDLNGDTITFKLAGGLSQGYSEKGGIVLLNANGTFTFIPKPSTDLVPGLTMDSFEVELSDGNGGFATTTVTLFADLKLDPKVTSNAGGVINGGVDIDDNDNVGLLTYSVGTGPNKGTVTVNADGTYTYTATTAGWNETDSFTIIGTVNGLSVTVATVSLVPKPNVAPTSDLLGGTVIPIGVGSGIATGNVNAHDENGDTLHYSVTGYGGGSTITLSNGSIVTVDSNGKWTYIPGLNSGDLGGLSPIITGSSFTVYITDGKGGQTSTPVIVTTHELDLPVTKIVNNGTVTGGLGLTAGEQGLMTYSVGTGPTKGTITVNADGTYTYTATTAGWNESDSFTIVGTINGQHITVAEVSVVPKSNAAPTSPLLDGATVIGGSGIATGTIGASDANGDTLHYSVTGHGGLSTKTLANGAIVTVDANGKWTYIPGLNSGVLGVILASSFTVYISDGKGGETSTLVTVNTHDLDIPVTKTGSNGTVTGGLGLTAGEQGLMTYKVGSGPSKGSVTVNADGTYTYNATAAGWNESDSFTIVGVVNGVEITVANVSVVPKVNSTPSSPLTDGATVIGGSGIATGNIGASDSDGDTLHYSVSGYGGSSTRVLSNGSIVTVDANGKWTYIPGLNSGDLGGIVPSIALSTFTVYVTDGKGGQTSTTVVVNTHELDIPVTKVGSNGTVTGGLSLTANEQGLMTYKVGTGPTRGIVTVNADGTYTYTATTAGWNQTDSFSIIGVINGVEITVAELSFVPKSNSAPNSPLVDGATIIGGSGIATGNIGASDGDGDTLHYSVTGYGGSSSKVLSNGSIVTVDANGKWSYVPGLNSGFLGAIVGSTFTVYVSDGKGGETSTLVTVTTHDLDIPITKVVNNGTVTGGLGLSGSEQGILTYSVGTGPTRGTVIVNPNGTYTYTATTAGFNQTDSFTIVGTVNGVQITVAELSFVPKPNQLPTTSGTGVAVGNGIGIAKGNVGASDGDGDALTYSVTGAGGASTQVRGNGAIVTVDANGNWAYVPKPNSGILINDTITIYVTDARGGTTTHNVNITTAQLHDIDYVATGTAGQGKINGIGAGDMGLFTFSKGSGGTGNVGAVTVSSAGVFTYTGALNQAVSFDIIATVGGQSFVIQTVNLTPPTINTSVMTKINTIGGGADEVQWNGITISGNNATLQKVSQLNGVASISGPTLGLWSVTYNSNNGSYFSKGSAGNTVVRAVDAFGFFSNSVTLTY